MKLKVWIRYSIVILAAAFFLQPQESLAKCKDVTMVVLGDSLSAGYGLGPGEGFPETLSRALTSDGFEAEIQNAGVSGDTSSGGLARLDWSVGEGVDIVLIELGANDALRGIPVEVTRKNLTEMVERLQKRDITVLLAGMLAPPNMGQVYGDEFKSIYSDLAKEYALEFYPFFLEGVAADPELNLDDGIHPNKKGIDVIVSSILPQVTKVLEKVCTQ